MNDRLRRLKAAAALGGFWGVATAFVSGLATGLMQLFSGGLSADVIVLNVLQHGFAGWLVGTAFAGSLIAFERRGILGGMKDWRISVWGAVMGGVLAPLVVVMGGGASVLTVATGLALAGVGATVGVALSVGTLRAAGSASRALHAGDEGRSVEAPEQPMLPLDDT
jgi:hypothetical protein